jgi:hypothetical protein
MYTSVEKLQWSPKENSFRYASDIRLSFPSIFSYSIINSLPKPTHTIKIGYKSNSRKEKRSGMFLE